MMTSAQITAPKQARVSEQAIPEVASKEVLIEIKNAGICGTDLHIWHGDYALARFPMIPGHEFSGVVADVGAEVKNFSLGDRVTADPNLPCYGCFFCQRRQFNQCLNLGVTGVNRDGAFANYLTIDESAVYGIANMDFAEAALLEPLACVVWGLQKVQIQAGDTMLIFGAGPMGILMMQAVKAAGASYVVMVDREASRLELAKALGASEVVLADELTPSFAQRLSPYGFDVVADATGVPKVISDCINYVRAGGKIWVFGVAPDGATSPFPPAEIFRKDIQIIGSFAVNKTFTESIALVQHGAVKLEPLISHQLPLEQFEDAIHLAEHDPNRMKVQFAL